MKIADLFCGAGGTSTGILRACSDLGISPDLLAVNHWDKAIATHSLNHPGVRHLCESLDNIIPRRAISGGRLNLLAASPECTHHSNAAGGVPKNDQSRATAWHVCRWASDLTVDSVMIENVPEFRNWGPLGTNGKPLKRRKGETFMAFINSLASMGFNVQHRVVNAADFGDATSRRRLLILARRNKRVKWPEPTHGEPDMINPLRPRYRAAREIIDWSHKGKSIFKRQRPLAPNTVRRIIAGLRKFGGVHAEPFIICMEHKGSVRSASLPLPTITTARGGAMALAEPFIVKMYGTNDAASVSAPLPTVTAGGGHLGICEPILLGQQSGHNGTPVSRPCPTIATSGAIALVEPFIVKYYGNEKSAESINEPLDTVTTKDRFMLVEPRTGRTVAEIDILFRMLTPNELAAAMSFPSGYKFSGNRADQVKQIGNAVPVNMAHAHAKALLQ